jgi:hypothetical protein
MHTFKHTRLPFSFNEVWITNRARNPDINLRNADDFHVQAHNLASLKRLPYLIFQESGTKTTASTS